ncbi:MAG: EAL domain-containing protein, partial [Bryobacteraceae bacterium]
KSARSVLKNLKNLRTGLKLDDFGTGYSSLSNLWALHFDGLKIDRSFVAGLAAGPESRGIVETMIKLAHALDMTVVAEGIEEERQIRELRRLGCESGQGFYFSRPVEAEAAERLLRKRAKRFDPARVA